MKKALLISLVMVLSLGIVAFAASTPTIVATHAVFGELAQAIGDDFIHVATIIPSGFCPAHYDLRPSDIKVVSQASLVIYSGFEPWMDTLLSSVGSKAKILQLKGPWNTPDGAAEKVDAIAAALSELLPDAQDALAANAAAYKARLAQIAAKLKKRADELGTASIPVICMQWQVPFVSWLGFDIVATYGVPEGLSMQDLVRLARVGKENGVRLVIDNLQSGIDFGAKLAQEVGAVHVVLSNFPGAMPHTATVLDLFVRNADSLFSAIAPIPGE